MSRYIDADLMREKAYQMNFHGRIGEHTLFLFNRALSEMPDADVVQVVRCKECQWFDANGDYYDAYCDKNGISVEEDFFCADGERKDGAEDGRTD